MNIGHIIKGNANAFFGLNKDVSEERMKICRECPLFTKKLGVYICNPNLFLNIKTGDISTKKRMDIKMDVDVLLKVKLVYLKLIVHYLNGNNLNDL